MITSLVDFVKDNKVLDGIDLFFKSINLKFGSPETEKDYTRFYRNMMRGAFFALSILFQIEFFKMWS